MSVVVTGSEHGLRLTHGTADIEPGLRLHYVSAGTGARLVVLLHGFPQTWYEWRHLIPALADAGFRVVAPDYRGTGHSWQPAGGYDKRTMAGTSAGSCASTFRSSTRSRSSAMTSA